MVLQCPDLPLLVYPPAHDPELIKSCHGKKFVRCENPNRRWSLLFSPLWPLRGLG